MGLLLHSRPASIHFVEVRMIVNELSTMINAASDGNSEDEGFKWRQKSNVELHLVSPLHLIFNHPSPAFTAH